MEYRTLSVELTDEEMNQKRDILVTRLDELDVVEQQRQAAAQGFKEQLKEIRGDIGTLAREVRTHKTTRVTACMWERDDARFSMMLVRQDTGEIVETRPMRDDERQLVFPTPPGEEARAGSPPTSAIE